MTRIVRLAAYCHSIIVVVYFILRAPDIRPSFQTLPDTFRTECTMQWDTRHVICECGGDVLYRHQGTMAGWLLAIVIR